jgi:hypothetical protein
MGRIASFMSGLFLAMRSGRNGRRRCSRRSRRCALQATAVAGRRLRPAACSPLLLVHDHVAVPATALAHLHGDEEFARPGGRMRAGRDVTGLGIDVHILADIVLALVEYGEIHVLIRVTPDRELDVLRL